MRKPLLVLLPLVVLAFLAASRLAGPNGLMWEATGSVSQNMCGKTFVSGLPPEETYRQHLRPLPGMWLASWAIRFDIDREAKEVRARILGGHERRSVFRAGRGCTLTYPGRPLPEPIEPTAADVPSRNAMTAASQAPIAPQSEGLRRAIDVAFAEPADGPARATKAVVVVHRGRIIGEQYAPGIGVDTPMLGHSLAKSVTNALIGILVRQGKLKVDDPAPFADWRRPGDPHAPVTIDHLMRMTAGFDVDEGGFPSTASDAWFTQPDIAAFARGAPLVSTPGRAWAYSSLSYSLLSRIIGDTVGGGAEGVVDFARRELFGPARMTHVTPEFDASGTMMGGHAIYATARDWARLGELYLQDGVVHGVRILPEGWAAYSTRPTSGATGPTGYGAGFWLNTTKEPVPVWGFPWGMPHVPADAFMGRGYLGQYVVVVPSEDLVVVRLGLSHGRQMEIDSVGRLVRGAIDALHAPRG